MESNRGDATIDNSDLIAANSRWVELRKLELLAKEEEIKKLQDERVRIKQEIAAMENWLLAINGGDFLPVETRVVKTVENKQLGDGEEELRGDSLRNAVVKVLEEAYPQDLYYREILRRLKLKGYQIGGKDPGLNLIAHITKDARLRRGEKRGIYGLADTYLKK
ncbi:MAG: hypothetical protein PHZ03_10840 [Syntrophomonas sp.]|nr:hypothetical protein [Syntrophomonas sp.]